LRIAAELRSERRYWSELSLKYSSFFSAVISGLLGAFLLALNQSMDKYFAILFILPLNGIVLCNYAIRAVFIAHRQFLEHTTSLHKVECMLGFYGAVRPGTFPSGELPFPKDVGLFPERYRNSARRFENSEEFVKAELGERARTHHYQTRVFHLYRYLLITAAMGALILRFHLGCWAWLKACSVWRY